MYVTDRNACNLPNSATPMSPGAIAAQNAYIARVGSSFLAGNDALQQLSDALGGNYVDSRNGNAGVPTVGTGLVFPSLGVGVKSAGIFACVPPDRLPMASVFPIPIVATPQSPAPPPNPYGTVPAIASGPLALPPGDCRSGDVCRDLRAGCVLQSQVSPEQLFACSQAGWQGNQNLFPATAAQGGAAGGAYFGSPNLAPSPATGFNGFTSADEGSGVLWASLALLLFSAYVARDWSRTGRR